MTMKELTNDQLITMLKSSELYGGVYEVKPAVLNEVIRRLNPWTRIDPADPGTLPQEYRGNQYKLSVHRINEGDEIIVDAIVENEAPGGWLVLYGWYFGVEDYTSVGSLGWIPYAYQPYPEPLPYKEGGL